jgi:hypothetical protein
VYSSRPVLHIRVGDDLKHFALIFVDAIKTFRSKVEQEDVGEAHKRACTVFTGQLEKHFVMLKEVQGEVPVNSDQGSVTEAKKHPLEDQAKSYDRTMEVVRNRGHGGARGRSH